MFAVSGVFSQSQVTCLVEGVVEKEGGRESGGGTGEGDGEGGRE